jgi:NAD(P)-dependent dehydrogenase (short-subunit alcohol dehydrogenase family)
VAERETAVILGGTRGIGAAVARQLAGPDVTLVLNHLQDSAAAATLASELEDAGAQVVLVEGNVADRDTRARITGEVEQAGGGCRRLVHSVAVTSFKPLSKVRANQWDLVFAVSVRSLVEMVGALGGALERAGGTVVAISSQGSVRHVPRYGALGPAKAALESVVRELAVEWGPRGVRVNAVRAGLVESGVLEHLPPELTEEVARRTPLGRLGTPAEIAAVACFLLGADSSWITGQIVEVDGGFSVV